MMRLVRAGTSGEVGQLAQQHVELDRASLHRNALDARAPLRISRASQQPPCLLRVGIRDNDRRKDALTALQHNTLARHNRGDGNAEAPRVAIIINAALSPAEYAQLVAVQPTPALGVLSHDPD